MRGGDHETEEERYWHLFGEGVRTLLSGIAAGVVFVFLLIAIWVYTGPWLINLFRELRP